MIGLSRADTLTLARIFSDGAVLQRGMEVPVWGTAEPGSEITVEFAGQKKVGVANEDGRWQIVLDPMSASTEPRTMKVYSIGNQTSEIGNILVGEVWLCGGQSNMQSMMYPFADDPEKDPHKDRPERAYRGLTGQVRLKGIQSEDTLFRQFVVDDTPSPFGEARTINSKQGWLKSVPGQTEYFTTVGYFFGKELRRELGVPVGLIDCNHGGSPVEAWMPKAAFEEVAGAMSYYDGELIKWRRNIDRWNNEHGTDLEGQKKVEKSAHNNHYIPGSLYNGLVHPLIPYAMKGAIWYQGESNRSKRNDTYGDSLAALIRHWRKNWGQEQLYFFIAQIAAWKEPTDVPLEKDEWGVAEIMNQQREVAVSVEDSGLAVLNDIGHHASIHPGNKMDVGKRLSRWALNKSYGKEIVPGGPLFKEARKDGAEVIITFDDTGSGLMTGQKVGLDPTVETDEPLGHFQLCGADREWKWAQAEISGKDSVTVRHADIADPVEVRYAWAANPATANLYNREGLPASIFKDEL